jgi:CelD/BcsL family acetyltransferase involved in cellulose biosynthesis
MGVANLFDRPGHRAFFLDLASHPGNRVYISRFDIGSLWAAANFGLVYRDSYYHVLSSYDDGEVAKFAPGSAHLRELMRFAIENGLTRFDFTVGDEPYKREWSDITVTLYDHMSAATLRGQPIVAATAAVRSLKRTIKQTPALWSLFSRLRAKFGGKAAAAQAPQRVEKSPPVAPT